MGADPPGLDAVTMQVLRALPMGIAIYDGERRAVLVNAAYCDGVGLPAESFAPGTTLEHLMRSHAARGVFGPGDPEEQARAMLAADRSRPTRLRRRRFGGRVFDLFSVPLLPSAALPTGGHAVAVQDITAFLQQRDEALAALRQVRDAVIALDLGLSVFAADRALVLCNPAFAGLMGLDPSQLAAGLSLQALLTRIAAADNFADHDDDLFLSRQRTGDRRQPWTERRVRTDGRVLDVASLPMPDGGFAITARDVTDLVRAEDESRRRAALLEGVVQALPVGVTVWGPERRLTMANDGYAEIFGNEAFPPGTTLEAALERRLATGELDKDYVERLRARWTEPRRETRVRPDGRRLDVRTAPLPGGGHVAVFSDVTALAQAEQAARARSDTLDLMLRHIRHGIMLWGADHALISRNDAALRLLGGHAGVVEPGVRLRDMLRRLFALGEFGQGETARLWRARLDTQDLTRSIVYQRVNPRGQVLEIHSDPTPDGGFVSTVTDITEIRRAEAGMLRAKEAAEAASRAKSRFLASMSHELRTPLNVIIGFADTLGETGGAASADPARVMEFAQAIHGSGRQLLGVINVILDVSRIEAGGLDLLEGAVDLGQVGQAAARQVQTAAVARGVRLVAGGPGVTPVRGDARRLQEVVVALLRTAVDSSEPGQAVTLATGANAAGQGVLAITDTGTPVAEADLPHVFDLMGGFGRSPGPRAAQMGLDLYAARTLLQAHGGDLLLKSDAAMGTSVVLTLPGARLADPDVADMVSVPDVPRHLPPELPPDPLPA